MTFEEQAAELARLKAIAKSLGMSEAVFDRIFLEATFNAKRSGIKRTPAQTIDEIRLRIYAPLTREPGAGA
jgi:transcriptional regulator GlxA family with amidase domain